MIIVDDSVWRKIYWWIFLKLPIFFAQKISVQTCQERKFSAQIFG